MTHKLNKAVLLLAAFATITNITSCIDKNENPNDGGLASTRYMVSTNSIVDTYFTPKKLNVCALNKSIYGDWFANENIGKPLGENNPIDAYNRYDLRQIYATHHYFVNTANQNKYLNIVRAYNKKVFIDKNDIQSPYKEYAEYFGDTLCLTDHTDYGDNYGFHACVLPVVAINVVCNKDFDSGHPAGTLLNDIAYLEQYLNYYNCLHQKSGDNLLYYGKTAYELYNASNFIVENMPLSYIPGNPILMMEGYFNIVFSHQPSTPGTYEFTVQFKFGFDPLTGETVEIEPATVSIDF